MDTAEQIAPRLKVLRESTGLDQTQFAALLGITQPGWNQFEKGTRAITLPVADRLVSQFKVTLDWIYYGDASGLPLRLVKILHPTHLNS